MFLGIIRAYSASKIQNRTHTFGAICCILLFDHLLKIYSCFVFFEKNLRRASNFEMFLFFCRFELGKRKLIAPGVFDVIVDNIWCSVSSMISNRTWLWRTSRLMFCRKSKNKKFPFLKIFWKCFSRTHVQALEVVLWFWISNVKVVSLYQRFLVIVNI